MVTEGNRSYKVCAVAEHVHRRMGASMVLIANGNSALRLVWEGRMESRTQMNQKTCYRDWNEINNKS